MKLCAIIVALLSSAICLCVIRSVSLPHAISVAKLPAEPSVEAITRGYAL